jgi:hypothetical protein
MDRSRRHLSAAATLLAAAIPLAACNVDVRKDDSNGKADVDITTPVGNVSVRTNVDAHDTGIAVYPGARPLEDEDEPRNANVNVGNSSFGVTVAAAKFESKDAQDRVVEFYRNELKSYGDVTECRGDVDFRRGDSGTRQAVCKEEFFSRDRDLQLVAGTEDNQHIVSVKPRGDRTEIALVHVQTRGKS